MLKVGDHSRYGRLGHFELLRRLGHAPTLHDREKHMQVPQPQAPADLTLPINCPCHTTIVIGLERSRELYLYADLPNVIDVALIPRSGLTEAVVLNHREDASMKAHYVLALTMVVSVALVGTGIKGLNAQNKPPAYVVIDITEMTDPEGFKAIL